MEFFTRTWLPATLLITAIGLGACDNNDAGLANSTAHPGPPGSTPAATENATEVIAAEVITVTRARIRATAPGQTVGGAFMTLTNASAIPYALTAVSCNAAGLVELHETSKRGGMIQMRRISQIDIPANGSVELKPGSYHVMLMELEKELTAGTTETLTLSFSDKSQMTVEASVGDLSE